jgi:hypothetical protein
MTTGTSDLGPPTPPTPSGRPVYSVLAFLGGVFGFWMLDIFAALLGSEIMGKSSLVTGALFAVIVSALVVILYRNEQRSIAAGLAVGYACLTIVSAGICTFWR